MTKKYSHVFSIAFTVESNHDAESVTGNELRAGLRKRLDDLNRVRKETGYDELVEVVACDDTEVLC